VHCCQAASDDINVCWVMWLWCRYQQILATQRERRRQALRFFSYRTKCAKPCSHCQPRRR